MITFSGLLLLMHLFMPWAMNTHYGDVRSFYQILNQPVAQTPEQARLLEEQKQKGLLTGRGNRGGGRVESVQENKPVEAAEMVNLTALTKTVQHGWLNNPSLRLGSINPIR